MRPEHESSGSNEPRRRRLVIDFHEARSAKSQRTGGRPSKPRRSWPKVVAVLAILLATVTSLAAGGIYLWWLRYQTTPAYSLALLIDAAQRKDIKTMDELVDTNLVINSLASRVTEKAAARYGTTLNPATRKRIETLVPGLLPAVREEARFALTKRVGELSAGAEGRPFIVMAIGLPYLVNITDEGDLASVTASGDKQIGLTMQRSGERWKVTGLNDDALVQNIVDKIIKDFPSIGKTK